MAKPKGPEITIGKKETRDLPVALSEEEVNTLGRKLPVMFEEMERIEEEKKQVMSEYAGRLKRKKAEAETVAREIRTEERVVPVELQWEYLWSENRKIIRRLDTQEEVDSMAIQEVERQQHFKGLTSVPDKKKEDLKKQDGSESTGKDEVPGPAPDGDEDPKQKV